MKQNAFDKLIIFLNNLEQGKISYTLAHNRDEAIMVDVRVPGEYWEVEFLADGTVEVERFVSNGEICGEESLSELLATHSDPEDEAFEMSESVTMMAAGTD